MPMHEDFEKRHVHSFYASLSSEFSATRHRAWPKIEEFYARHVGGADLILDAGSGNGRNLLFPERSVAADYSLQLLGISRERRACISHCRLDLCHALPFKSGVFDAAISVAAIHHIASHERRLGALRAILRVLKGEGLFFLCVWSSDPGGNRSKFVSIPPLEQPGSSEGAEAGRGFSENDVFATWKNRAGADRYYHLFEEGEAEALAREAGFRVVESGLDHGNRVVLCRK